MKKKTPLSVLQQLESFVDLQGEDFIRVDDPDSLIKFIDTDPESEFYFKIKKYEKGNHNTFTLIINFSPYNANEVKGKDITIDIQNLNAFMDKWTKLLSSYNKIKSPFDDPIFNHHYNTYFSEFSFVDEEDSELPLTSENILLLDEYLEKVSLFLEENIHEDEPLIQEIQKEISEIRKNLGRKSKKWIAGKMSWVWGKVTMLGPKLMKSVVDEANKKIVKEAIDSAFKIGKNLLDNF